MKKLLLVFPLFLAACTTAPMYGDCLTDNVSPHCIKNNGGGQRGLSTGSVSAPSSPSQANRPTEGKNPPGRPNNPGKPSNPGKPGGSKPGHGHGDGNHGHSGPPSKGDGKGKGKK